MSLILDGSNGLSDVDGTAATPAIRGTDANTGIFFPAADTIAFSEGGSEVARFDSAGNLGIGTTTPSSFNTTGGKLVVAGGTVQALFSDATNYTLGIKHQGSGAVGMFGGTAGSSLALMTDNTERMRIDSSGNLLVGTTSTSPSSGVGTKIQPTGFVRCVSADSTNSTENWSMYSTGASNYRFYVGWGGTIYATSTTITSLSDERVKENIADIDVGLDAVMALKPRRFDWKAGKGKDIKGDRGFIAQEFETVFPEMIDTWKDPAPEGEEPYKAVNADLIPILVKAIQEQQVMITELKATVDAQAARIAALENPPVESATNE